MNAEEMKLYLQNLCSGLSQKGALLAALCVGFPAGDALASGDEPIDIYAGPPIEEDPAEAPPVEEVPEKPADPLPPTIKPSPDDAVGLYAAPPVMPGPGGLGIAPKPQETPPDAGTPDPQQAPDAGPKEEEKKDGKKVKLKIPPIKPVRPPIDHIIALYAAPPLPPPQNRDQKK